MENLEVMLVFDGRNVICSRSDTWQELWKYASEKSIWNDAIGRNQVYLAAFNGLYALGKETGTLAWKKEGFEKIQKIITHNDTVLVADMAQGMQALSAQDGGIIWNFKKNRINDLLESGGKIYAASSVGLFSLGAEKGNSWELLNKSQWFSLEETRDAIYAANENCILKINKNSESIDTYTCLYSAIQRITADENVLYISTKKCIAALDGRNLALKWEKNIENIDGAFKVQASSLYAAEWHGKLYAIDKDKGEIQWEHEYPHYITDVKEILFRDEDTGRERGMLLIEDTFIARQRKTHRYLRIPGHRL